MFGNSFCETTWDERSRRGWSTLISFGIQATAVTIVLAIPLLYTQGIPQVRMLADSVFFSVPAAPPAPLPLEGRQRPLSSNMTTEGQLVQPPTIPRTVETFVETTAPQPIEMSDLRGIRGVIGSTGRSRAGVPYGDPTSIARGPDVKPAAVVRQPLTSRMAEGNLIVRVQPVYPKIAILSRVQGTVVLHAIISRDGRIEQLRPVSGPAVLIPAATDAVSRWRYRPYYLNDQPIEVETQVIVTFTLSGSGG